MLLSLQPAQRDRHFDFPDSDDVVAVGGIAVLDAVAGAPAEVVDIVAETVQGIPAKPQNFANDPKNPELRPVKGGRPLLRI